MPDSFPSATATESQNPTPDPSPIAPPTQTIVPPPKFLYVPPQIPAVFRPVTPQLSPLPIQPPGVGSGPSAGMMLLPPYAVPGQQIPPNTAILSPCAPTSNVLQAMPPPGIPRYGSPYNPMVRPVFLPRPPGVLGAMPPMMRPPIGIRGPLPAAVRPPVIASVALVEKPQTTVYVGKIASTVESDFILAVLQLCGPIKSWKRAQDPSTGKPKGFGFCEFESAEGVLRALRLLSKLNIDGQELMMNVNQATKDYLERYAEKKDESSKEQNEAENVGAEKRKKVDQVLKKKNIQSHQRKNPGRRIKRKGVRK